MFRFVPGFSNHHNLERTVYRKIFLKRMFFLIDQPYFSNRKPPETRTILGLALMNVPENDFLKQATFFYNRTKKNGSDKNKDIR